MSEQREHPIAAVLRDQGRKQTWLADRIGYSDRHLNQVIRGTLPASPEFRRKCAEALGIAEDGLFILTDEVDTVAVAS